MCNCGKRRPCGASTKKYRNSSTAFVQQKRTRTSECKMLCWDNHNSTHATWLKAEILPTIEIEVQTKTNSSTYTNIMGMALSATKKLHQIIAHQSSLYYYKRLWIHYKNQDCIIVRETTIKSKNRNTNAICDLPMHILPISRSPLYSKISKTQQSKCFISVIISASVYRVHPYFAHVVFSASGAVWP